jgi:hypothetical protein
VQVQPLLCGSLVMTSQFSTQPLQSAAPVFLALQTLQRQHEQMALHWKQSDDQIVLSYWCECLI